MLIVIILQVFSLIPGILAVRNCKIYTLQYYCTYQFQFDQNDYLIIFERGELSRYNKEYFQTAKVVTFKYNRTQAACNVTLVILKDLGYDVEVIIFSTIDFF